MRWIQTGLVLVVLALGASVASTRAAQQPCLHASDETPEQVARRNQAIGFSRDVNTQQFRAFQTLKTYLPLDRLSLKRTAPDGFEVRLSADAKGYSFSVIDQTDPCRLGYFSNEAGVIYRGEALR